MSETTGGSTEFGRMHAALQKHPGWHAIQNWQQIKMLIEAAQINEYALLEVVTIPLEASEAANQIMGMFDQSPEGRQRQQEFWTHLFVNIANYTNTNYLLIQHVRSFVRRYEGTEFETEYNQRVKRMLDTPETRFVNDLRRVITHIRTPPLSVTLSGGQGKETAFDVNIDSAPLLARPGDWSTASRHWLEKSERVDIRQVVLTQNGLRDGLYEWFMGRLDSLHGPDIEDYNVEVRRLNEWWGLRGQNRGE